MHGLLFNIKSDKDKYGGSEFQLDYKILFKDPNKQWDDNIANTYFVNGLKEGSPEKVKSDINNQDYDKFYQNLQKLYDTNEIQEIGSKMSGTQTHIFENEGIILFCVGETTV
ncbi:hypothetical protein LJB96_05680 [Methanobrevibacter sp. OttesenSCG-928-K11]|nr:hypothetical protein [Methanobrevibacter sp. OttesenSCG-928-K11]